uniref:Uncharacterized protein n=1 Tax=Anopheles culicifacies TaxID=139723 RepID=A0A182MKW6_9DIPT
MTVPHMLDGGPQVGYQTVSASPTTITTNTTPASNTLLRQNLATMIQHQQQTMGGVGGVMTPSTMPVQCNLCRKKHCILPAIYCTDCETYLARFQMPVRR